MSRVTFVGGPWAGRVLEDDNTTPADLFKVEIPQGQLPIGAARAQFVVYQLFVFHSQRKVTYVYALGFEDMAEVFGELLRHYEDSKAADRERKDG